VGRLAKQYGMLPSEVIQRATTFDLMVTDVLATYDEYIMHKSSGTIMPQDDAFSVDELYEIMEKANEQH
jgi:hypothetical protein